jgi:spore coat polysaccharide biosynthesis protein SpsF
MVNNMAVFLSARNKATRLPGKELIEIHGKTVIGHLISRLKRAKQPGGIVLCTSTHSDDRILVDLAQQYEIEAFCGSEDDKLVRYRDAARKYGVNNIAVVDGDDLFCEPLIIDATLAELAQGEADYVMVKELPLGAACFGVTRAALEKVCELKQEQDTEVWGGYFTETGLFTCKLLEAKNLMLKRPDLRLTLDYPEDLQLFEAIFDRLDPNGASYFALQAIIEVIEKEPELARLNAAAQQKYLKNLQTKPAVRVKVRQSFTPV